MYDDSNIDNKEQVRDQDIMMSNTATFILHIRKMVKQGREKMAWVLRVFVMEVLTHADILEISCHSGTRVLLPAQESVEIKDVQAIKAIQQKFTFKISEAQH